MATTTSILNRAGQSKTIAVIAAIAAALPSVANAASAQSAQNYPDHPIRLIVTFAAGAGTDVAARLFGQKLTDVFGQQVVVDNRPGASGIIGSDIVAKASPDGYTLMTATTSHTSIPALHKKIPYDTIKDFSPVTMLVDYPLLLVVHPSVQAKTVKELIALAKAKPGYLTYASSGSGSGAHLTVEFLKSETGIDLVHVPYKGIAGAVIGTISGENNLSFYSVSSALSHIKGGRLRALATSGQKRTPAIPDLLTVAESGVPGYDFTSWVGILATAGTPQAIINKLHGELTRALQMPDVKERLAALDFDPKGNTPAEFDAFIRKEVAKWTKVVKTSGIRVE